MGDAVNIFLPTRETKKIRMSNKRKGEVLQEPGAADIPETLRRLTV